MLQTLTPEKETAASLAGQTTAVPAVDGAPTQGADSRVPTEARRMSAAPYGAVTAAAVRHPGARRTEDRPVRPARPAPQARPREDRQQVGYAPGRMGERDRARLPREELRYGREYQSGRAEAAGAAASYLEKGKKKKGKGRLLLILALVLVLLGGAVAAAMFLLPEDHAIRRTVTSVLGGAGSLIQPAEKEPPRAQSFVVTGNQGVTAPADVTFSLTTGKDVREIRITDEDGVPLPTTLAQGINTDDIVWILTLHVEDGYEGTVRLQALREGEDWRDTGDTAELAVASIPAVTSSIEVKTAPPETIPPEEILLPAEGTSEDAETTDTPDAADPADTPEGTAAEIEGETENETIAESEGETAPEAEEGNSDSEAEQSALAAVSEVINESDSDEASGADEGAREAPTPLPEGADTVVPLQFTATPKPTDTPAPTQVPTPTPALEAVAAPEADPSLVSNTAIYIGSKRQKEYNRPARELIRMPAGEEYSRKPMGVLTFRGNAFRQNAFCGTVSGADGLAVAWMTDTGSSRGATQTYYGVGWTGQPAIVKWSKEVREKTNITEEKREKSGLKEVIIAGLDGAIRFLDLEDGKITRNSIKLGYPLRGTPSVHPGGYPYMNVGQYARKMKAKTGKIGLRQYNLYSQKEMTLIDGLDGTWHRAFNDVGSFETSSLIDRTSDTVITAGTNGLLYLHSLNSDFDYQAGVYKANPSTVVLKAKAKTEKSDTLTAVESSLAMYDKYVFYADMGGVLRCVDTDRLKIVWAVDTGDSVMAAVALDQPTEDRLDLYTANMLNNRKKGNVQIRKIDALTGAGQWVTEIPVVRGKKNTSDIGAKASPVIGQNTLQGLVYYTVTGLSEEGQTQLGLAAEDTAALIALDKADGRVVWALGLGTRCESSPVAVYDAEGAGWIIQCTQDGRVLLLQGLTGQPVATLQLQGEIEASPAVYNHMMVVGTTGKGTEHVYGIRILSDNEPAPAESPAPTDSPTPEQAPEAEEQPTPEEIIEEEELDEDTRGIG